MVAALWEQLAQGADHRVSDVVRVHDVLGVRGQQVPGLQQVELVLGVGGEPEPEAAGHLGLELQTRATFKTKKPLRIYANQPARPF